MNENTTAILNVVKTAGGVHVKMFGEDVFLPCKKLLLVADSRNERLQFLPTQPDGDDWVLPAGKIHLENGKAVLGFRGVREVYTQRHSLMPDLNDTVQALGRIVWPTKILTIIDLEEMEKSHPSIDEIVRVLLDNNGYIDDTTSTTMVKNCLIVEGKNGLAGLYIFENRVVNGVWFYSLRQIHLDNKKLTLDPERAVFRSTTSTGKVMAVEDAIKAESSPSFSKYGTDFGVKWLSIKGLAFSMKPARDRNVK